MTDAIEAIRVPQPPTFTPLSSSRALSVNWERSRVAGTFESTWLRARERKNSLPFRCSAKNVSTDGREERFPTRMKRAMKVAKRE